MHGSNCRAQTEQLLVVEHLWSIDDSSPPACGYFYYLVRLEQSKLLTEHEQLALRLRRKITKTSRRLASIYGLFWREALLPQSEHARQYLYDSIFSRPFFGTRPVLYSASVFNRFKAYFSDNILIFKRRTYGVADPFWSMAELTLVLDFPNPKNQISQAAYFSLHKVNLKTRAVKKVECVLLSKVTLVLELSQDEHDLLYIHSPKWPENAKNVLQTFMLSRNNSEDMSIVILGQFHLDKDIDSGELNASNTRVFIARVFELGMLLEQIYGDREILLVNIISHHEYEIFLHETCISEAVSSYNGIINQETALVVAKRIIKDNQQELLPGRCNLNSLATQVLAYSQNLTKKRAQNMIQKYATKKL